MAQASPVTLATRRSPLALAQTDLALAALRGQWPDRDFRVLHVETTGDVRETWSLESTGGAGLFTAELERRLLAREADLAVHSAKDMPTQLAPGLELAGFLPREDPRDVLILRGDVDIPRRMATSSPRRREQMRVRFPAVEWVEIRGNIDTRLRKVAEGQADGTFLALAGLRRLHIQGWPGLTFETLPVEECIPAAGQGAIAVEGRSGEAEAFAPATCAETTRAVRLERQALRLLGGGCHSAAAVHFVDGWLHLFHAPLGRRSFDLSRVDDADLAEAVVESVSAFLR